MGVEQKRAAIEMTHSRHAISELEGVSSRFSVRVRGRVGLLIIPFGWPS